MRADAEILLVRPDHSFLKKELSLEAPLGLAYLASYLRERKVPVKILDALVLRLGTEETVKRIVDSPARFVGFTALLITLPIVYHLARRIKQSCDKTIIIGGPFSTFMPEKWLNEGEAIDIIVRGEGERTLLDIVNGMDLGGIRGITYREQGAVYSNPDREFIENIDEIPFPARDLLPQELYLPRFVFSNGSRGRECAAMITARGCVNKCYYCSASHFWQRFRPRSPENILSEIEQLTAVGVKHIDFADDTFTVTTRIEKICGLILTKKIKITWGCFGIISHVSAKMLELMREAGCYAISFAPESGNQDILDNIEKKISLEQTSKTVGVAKKLGIKVTCQFMVGIPGDTGETIQETEKFAIKLNPHFATFTPTTPFPGTKLYNEYIAKGILSKDYKVEELLNRFLFIETDELSSEEIKGLRNRLVRRFYFRFSFFLIVLKRVLQNPCETKEYLRAMRAFLFEKTDLNSFLKLNYRGIGKT